MIQEAVATLGCPLCGEYHEAEFHSYPWRWTIDCVGVRIRSRIATLICRALRGTGRPYTCRIMPEHQIPRSPFSCERLCRLLEGHRDPGTLALGPVCEALGCIDPRTARKHIAAVVSAVMKKLPILANILAAQPCTPEEPPIPPDTPLPVLLRILWASVLGVVTALGGSSAARAVRPLVWLTIPLSAWQFFNRSCIPIPVPP